MNGTRMQMCMQIIRKYKIGYEASNISKFYIAIYYSGEIES